MKDDSTEIITVENEIDDRYSRLRLIPWWDQEKLKKTKVLVVGAGALGNEILKNLALLGVGNILIADMDAIEDSNLSRSILFRETDEGRGKAETAAKRVIDINPDCRVHWVNTNIVYGLGLGVYRWADLVFGGLDNREARLSINQSCWKVGTPWIDGAIEVFFGTVKVFSPPDTACYECTMNDTDYRLLNMRRSCALLTRKDMLEGKTPTTPTIASIIGGIQVSEALKLIHGQDELPTLEGKGLFFNGLTHDSYIISYDRKEFCLSHESYPDIQAVPLSTRHTTLNQLLVLARGALGDSAVLELEKELVYALKCDQCGLEDRVFKTLGTVTEEEALCPGCRLTRTPEMTHTITGSEPFLDLTLESIGIPEMDIVRAYNEQRSVYYELVGDTGSVLGELDR